MPANGRRDLIRSVKVYGQNAEWFNVKAGGAYTVCFFYRCPEHRSCHGCHRRLQAFCPIKLPCSLGLALSNVIALV